MGLEYYPNKDLIALKFDRHFGSTAAEVPVKFQSDSTVLNTNLAASGLCEILRKDIWSDIETGRWHVYVGPLLPTITAGTQMTSAAADDINHNGHKIGQLKPIRFC